MKTPKQIKSILALSEDDVIAIRRLNDEINQKLWEACKPTIPDTILEVDIGRRNGCIPVIWNTKDDIKLDNQFFKLNKMNNKEQTEGEKRVRKSFNPSSLVRVENFKATMASAIDQLNDIGQQLLDSPSRPNVDPGDFLRELATAKTQLQIASMCGVAALTHELAFTSLPNTVVSDIDPEQEADA